MDSESRLTVFEKNLEDGKLKSKPWISVMPQYIVPQMITWVTGNVFIFNQNIDCLPHYSAAHKIALDAAHLIIVVSLNYQLYTALYFMLLANSGPQYLSNSVSSE